MMRGQQQTVGSVAEVVRLRSELSRVRLRREVLAAGLLFVIVSTSLADDPPAPPPNVVEELPAVAPAWLDGYRIRYPLRFIGDPAKTAFQSVIAILPTGGWLKPDGSDVAVQNAAGQLIPVDVLSHNPTGDTVIQFKRNGNDPWYWAYAANPQAAPAKAEPIREGLTVEVRAWAGDNLESWAVVREGLTKSESVVGNAVVAEIVQNCNPVRPGESRNFAASYRGFLDIKVAGVYRFFVNSEDAGFLFIDGFKVCDRPGINQRVVGQVPIKTFGTELELTAGVHPFEVHHVMGNSPTAYGICTLLWLPPGQNHWSYVPAATFVSADYAQVAAIQSAGNAPAAAFGYGIDDALTSSDGVTVYLVRFEAQGSIPDPQKLVWDFGDGTTGSGRTATHVYFKRGDYNVSVHSGDARAAFRRSVHVWAPPGTASPLSLGVTLKSLTETDWKLSDPERINQMFMFLLACEQPDRWGLVEQVARHLLTKPDHDPQFRTLLHTSLMQALAHLGREKEALKMVDPALLDLKKLPGLQIEIKLAAAAIHHRHLKDAAEAGRIYETLIEENRRLEKPALRIAAIRWGDLFAESGDLVRAGECYRLAGTLGGDAFAATAQTEAITRGGLLRIAEQKLRAGDIKQTRVLLERIELNFPEQKLEGMYRFMRAEVDRFGGRYEDALLNYEVLLKLTQWAGFRDRTLHGIADTYYRMTNFEKSLEWLAALKTAFPKYFETQKLQDFEQLIVARRDRLKAAQGTPQQVTFKDFATNFEPEEKLSFGKPTSFTIARGLGLAGPHVGLLDGYPLYKPVAYGYSRPLSNLTGNGNYWIELWYRESLIDRGPPYQPHITMTIHGEEKKSTPPFVQTTTYFERTFGQWRKFGFRMTAPLTQDGRLEFTFQHSGIRSLEFT